MVYFGAFVRQYNTIQTRNQYASPPRSNAILAGPFAQKGYTPYSDFYKIWLGEGVPGPHPRAKFHRCGLEMWVYSPQDRQNWYFLYKFAQKRYTPLSDFL